MALALTQALPLFLVLFDVGRCAVFNDVATVTKARCHANCITQLSQSAGPDAGCHGNPCKQCVSPCGRKWTTAEMCKTTCGHSLICQKSCDFLAYLHNLSSVLDGNRSIATHPGIPVATNKTLSSLTLSWRPVDSLEGSVVYLLKKKFNGDVKGRFKEMTNLVFTEPKAVLEVKEMCEGASIYRRTWDGVHFNFQVIALTEHSDLVASPESSLLDLTRPEPVSAIGMPRFAYDAKAFGDKLKLTTTVTPAQAQAHLITKYALEWSMSYCAEPYVVPRSSQGAATTLSVHLYEKLKACNHKLEVYALYQCIPSLPRTLKYEYKGCDSVSNYSKSLCYSFDPPATPDSARSVGNLTHSPLKSTDDFRFTTNITWLAPTFPYGKVQTYHYAYGDVTKMLFGIIWLATRGNTMKTSLQGMILKPNITVRVEVRPQFPNAAGVVNKILFRTPAIPEDQIRVQNLAADDFQFSPSNLFSVRVHWERSLAYSQANGYQIDFWKGHSSLMTIKTTETSHVIGGLIHNEPLIVKVKPLFKVSWFKPKYVALHLHAPAPFAKDIVVKHLRVFNFTHDTHTNTFTGYFDWEPPSYSHRGVDHYQVGYTMIGGYGKQEITCPSNDANKAKLCMPATTKASHYTIPRLHPHIRIILSIKPVFQQPVFTEGIRETYSVDVPYAPVLFCDGKPVGYYTDSEDCTAFYRCNANGGTFHMFCPAGLYWDNKNQTCDLPKNVDCQTHNQSCCQAKLAGYYKVENNLAAFCVCDGNGKGFLRMCASGLYWNDVKRACDLPKLN